MSLMDSLDAFHDRAAALGGPLGRLLFGVRLPLLYPLVLLLVGLYLWFPPSATAPPPAPAPEAQPVEAQVEVVPRVLEAPAMPEPLGPEAIPPEPIAEPAAAPAKAGPKAAPKPQPAGGKGNADWLLSLPPEGYTLQLLGSRQEQTLRAFVRRHGLESMTAYYRTRHKGGIWYVLLYGLYADREEASVAVGTLPPAVRKNAPFPRTIQSVQKAIREGR